MPITPLPPAPQRKDEPDLITQKADAMFSALPNFVTEANALETNVNAKEVSANAAAVSATTQAGLATTARIAAEEARDEAVGAAATLPDGIVNDAIISTTDTWSSSKISSQVGYMVEYTDSTVMKTTTSTSIGGGVYKLATWFCDVSIELNGSTYELVITPFTFDVNNIPVFGAATKLALSTNIHIPQCEVFGDTLGIVLFEVTANAIHLVAATHSGGVVTIGAKQTVVASGSGFSNGLSIASNSSTNGIITFQYTSSFKFGAAFTLSGTVFTIGTPTQIINNTGEMCDPIKIDNNKYLTLTGSAVILISVSGTTITSSDITAYQGIANSYKIIKDGDYYFLPTTNSGVSILYYWNGSSIEYKGYIEKRFTSRMASTSVFAFSAIEISADTYLFTATSNGACVVKKHGTLDWGIYPEKVFTKGSSVSTYGFGAYNGFLNNGYVYLQNSLLNSATTQQILIKRYKVNV